MRLPQVQLLTKTAACCRLVEDTAWHPVMPADIEKWTGFKASIFKFILGSPLKCFASIGHWAIWHFDLNKYTPRQKPRVIVSLAAVFAFMGIVWPALIYYTGIAGWAKYWLMPWLGYHFWMSTFTVIHHTAPHIPFKVWQFALDVAFATALCLIPRVAEVGSWLVTG